MKKIRLIASLIFFCLIDAVSAAEYMRLYLNDGSSVYLDLKCEPVIEFTENGLIIESQPYAFGDILKYDFRDKDADLNNVELDNDVSVVFRDDIIEITGISDVEVIKVFDIQGRAVRVEKRKQSERKIILYPDNIAAGNYVISIKEKAYKFYKK